MNQQYSGRNLKNYVIKINYVIYSLEKTLMLGGIGGRRRRGRHIYIPADTNDIYMVVEDPPEFPGGLQALSDYLRDNIKYPEACRKDSIQGRVIISFVVEKDGSISSAEVIKSVHEQLDAEALRVISAMPKWKPGKQRGKVVRVEYAIPIKYRLDGSPYLTVPKRTDRIIENTTADIIEIVEEDSYIESIL